MYRLEEYTGKLYTEEEFIETYIQAMPDAGILKSCWEQMTIIHLQEGQSLEELKKKLQFIYNKGVPVVQGDMILFSNPTDGTQQVGFVMETWGKLIIESAGWFRGGGHGRDGERFECNETYLRVDSVSGTTTNGYYRTTSMSSSTTSTTTYAPISLVQKMKPMQMLYNVAMNTLGSLLKK